MGMTTLTSPVELWRKLCSDAGLELRLKSGRPGRDADIEDALRKALNVPSTARSLEAWLVSDARARQPQTTVEVFLLALLKQQAGFAQMMQDILATLVAANARHAEHSLSIAFKFEGMDDPVVQTLEQFRESVSSIRRLLETRPTLPDSKTMWDIFEGLRAIVPSLNDTSRPAGFPSIPKFRSSGDAALDKQLAQIAMLVCDVQGLWRSYGADRHGVVAAAGAMSGNDQDTHKLRDQLYAASDFWDRSVIDCLQQVPIHVASGALAPQHARSKLTGPLSRVKRDDTWVHRTVQELLDVLALPAWRRRHELYSVWVGTRLLEVVREAAPKLRFNPVDGVLSFAFGGSRLATYELQGKEYEIWAELRSALVGSSTKRKRGIQPDFRVVQAGLSPVGDRTVYVLECKHYLQSSAQNFTTAAKDYASSCPGAIVHVVNHGPADEKALSAALSAELRPAVRFFGDTNVGNEVQSGNLRNAMRGVLFPGVAASRARSASSDSTATPILPAGCVGQVFLEWDCSLEDMDLALLVIAPDGAVMRTVSYRDSGEFDGPPFARLHADVRQGPGVERIDIAAWHFNRYHLVATNYSKRGAMTPDALECRIVTPEGLTSFRCPPGISLRHEWRIAELIVHDGKIDIVPIDSAR